MANMSPEERQRRSDHMKQVQANKRQQKENLIAESVQAAEEAIVDEVTSVRSPNERIRKRNRQGRAIFNGTQQAMEVFGEIDGYVLHWFNNTPGRLALALQDDWEFVTQEEVGVAQGRLPTEANIALDGKIEIQVRNTGHGPGGTAVLMKKPKEWVEEDHAQMQQQITKRERDIVKNKGVDSGKIGPTYVPGTNPNAPALKISSNTYISKGENS